MNSFRTYLILFFLLIAGSSGVLAANFTFTAVWKEVTCTGGSDGSGTVTEITGAKKPVTYRWYDSKFNLIGTDSLINGLTSQKYTLVIRDADGTEKGEFHTITEPDIVILNPIVTDLSCYGSDDGTITATAIVAAGRTAQFSIDSGAYYQSSGVFLSLASGNYHLFVKDSEGCFKSYNSNPLTIAEPDQIIITTDVSSKLNLSCYGDSDGSIDITVSGGSPAYSCSWSGPGGFNSVTEDIASLKAGDYFLTVTDSKSCTQDDMITVSQPLQIIITKTVSNISCHGSTDGSIDVTVSGGTPPYDYAWTSDGAYTATTEDISDLSAGNYYLEVTDDNGCIANSGTIKIIEPAVISVITDSSRNVTCNSGNDGAIFITVSGGTPGYTLEWSGPGGYTSPDEDPSDLSAGNYTLLVTDSRGCTSSHGPITITQPPAITIGTDLTSKLSLLCHNDADGSIDISIAGGTPGYSYLWTGPSGYISAVEDISGLKAGDYYLTVTDANDCQDKDTITITEPTVITIQIDSLVDVSCFGLDNGSIGVTVTGGTPMAGPSYVYAWTSDLGFSSASEDLTGLSPDNYYLTVTDDNSCTAAGGPLTISEPAILAVVVDSTRNVSCYGGNDGAIYITTTGGTIPYAPEWSGPGGFNSTSQDITNLLAGDYTLHLSDANGCIVDKGPVSITEPSELVVVIDSSRQITCHGAADGKIYSTTAGGTPPYTFAWTSSGGYSSSSPDVTSLSPADYTLTVTDNKGCIESAGPAVIIDPPVLNASVVPLTSKLSLNCYGDDDGNISIVVTGGTPGYTYAWTGPGGYSSPDRDISNLKAGDYGLTVTDINGCAFSTGTISITQPALLSVILVSSADINCYGEGNGKIVSSTSGGTIPYSFAWSGPDGYSSNDADSITNLEAGDYQLMVTDAKGCQDSIPSASIDEPDSIYALILPTSKLITGCTGSKNGRIYISVTGGIPGYTYSWTGPDGYTSTSKNILGLASGDYNLTITDLNTCHKTYTPLATIAELPAVEISLEKEDISCYNDNDGQITAHASGGTSPFEFSRNAITWQADSIFAGLSPGGYIIFVKDKNKCQTYDTAVITQPSSLYIGSEIKVDSNNVCYGDTKGIIIITAGGGTAPLEFSIDSGYTYRTHSTFTGLPAGEYQTIIRDANECTMKGNKNVITQPSPILISSYSQDDITTCYDAAEGSIFILATGGEGTKTYTRDSAETNIFGIFDNVTAGSHLIRIQDSKGCFKDTTVVILAPLPLTFYLVTITDVTGCHGDGNGAIYSPAQGGTGTLQYALDEGDYQDSARWQNLKAGSYTITVMDDNACTHDTILNISEPDTVGYSSLDITPITCRGDLNGIISINGSGGNPPYTYTLNPGSVISTTGTFTGLPPGTYTVGINGTGDCPAYTSGTILLPDPPRLAFDSTETILITCHGSDDGNITVYAMGGVNPLQYSADDGSTFSSGNVFSDLPANTYHTLARDANGCVVRGDTVILIDPPGIDIVTQTATDTVCFGDYSGLISVAASGGTLSLEYTIDSVNWQLSGDFTGLSGGKSYVVTIRDENNCTTTSDSFTISQYPAILTDITANKSINGQPGSILISSSGGTGNHEFSVYGLAGTFQTDTAFTGLWPGDYEVVVRDEAACTHTEMITLEAYPPLKIAVSSNNNQCYGDSTGTITLSSLNGVGIVKYSIDNGITTGNDSIFRDLSSGTYYIYTTDEDHRIFRDTVYITSPEQLILTIKTVNQVSCPGLADGSVYATISGGVQPYDISWTSTGGFSSSDTVISGLESDVYEMTVTDDSMCVVQSGPITISEPLPITIITDSIKNISCFGFGDGAVYTSISGGTQPYFVLWTGPDTYHSTVTDITGLDTGSYNLVVTDSMGCTANHGPDTITEPDTLTVSISGESILEINCYGADNGSISVTVNGGTPVYSCYWSGSGGFSSTKKDISNLGGGDYYLLLYDSHSCPASTGKVNITEPPEIIPAAVITPATCYRSTFDGSISLTVEGGVLPLTYLWSNDSVTSQISGLNTGSYSVLITDADNCSVNATYEVTSISSIKADAGKDTSVCTGKQLQLDGRGGDSYLWQPNSGLSDPNIADPLATITGPVCYYLTVSDINGCTNTDSVTISVYPLLGIDAGNDITASIDKVVQLSASGGSFERYSWRPATGIDDPAKQSPLLTVTGESEYFVTGSSIFGCDETDSVRIFIAGQLIIYSGFTPNGDGTNDHWDIDNADYYPDIKVMVFNRWGKQIFHAEGYSDEQRWDGKYNGKDVPTGTYYYIIELGNGAPPLSGTVTIIR